MHVPIIQVENLSKVYRIGAKEEIADTLLGAALAMVKAPVRNFKQLASLNTFSSATNRANLHAALNDVSFDVREGEVLGIIGHNGAGKSTLLKILSRITQPTAGRAIIRGRVSSLLEVGTGFHPELSGRENVYLNGTILGMRKTEIARKFDEIVDFSGVEKFLDTPIKRYSSGMKVRLAFAVSAFLDPEILIIDEVLAVGDKEFQDKCMGKMKGVAHSGRTVLFVSHNLAAVKQLCHTGMRLAEGKVADHGKAGEIVENYLNSHRQSLVGPNGTITPDFPIANSIIKSIRMFSPSGNEVFSLSTGDTVRFVFELETPKHYSDAAIVVIIVDDQGHQVTMLNSRRQWQVRFDLDGRLAISCIWKRVPLPSGTYAVRIRIAVRGIGYIDDIAGIHHLQIHACDLFNTGRYPSREEGVFVPDVQWDHVMNLSASTEEMVEDKS